MILVINNSFPELNYLAAGLAEKKLLSCYVRPYANTRRGVERGLARIPLMSFAYSRTLGRREMPTPLASENILQAALGWDFAIAMHARLPYWLMKHRQTRTRLLQHWSRAIASTGARALRDECVVVAAWGCAEPAFRVAKARGAVCVLNYSLAHHAFTQRYLQEEAAREPAFASTLNSHDLPVWQLAQLDREIALADHILVGSSFVRDTFIAEGVPAAKLEVIPYGVDTSLFRPRTRRAPVGDSFNIIFAGQLSQRKGLSYLLRAYEQIRTAKTSLTLVGQMQDDGTALNPWRHLFSHIPHVPREKLADLFQQSDVFALPTLVEGMPLVVVEAMASALPVVSTPNGSGDIIRDGVDGYLVAPRDVDGLAARLRELQQDLALRTNLGANAALRARDYNWDAYRRTTRDKLSSWMRAAR